MKRATFLLLISVATLNVCCQPETQNGNGKANTNSNSNVNEVEAFIATPGDKSVAISVTEDLAQVSLPIAKLILHPTDKTKHQKIRWCTYNNTAEKTIDWVRIEAKAGSALTDPFEDRLPLIENKNIGPDDSHCTKKYTPKRPGTFDYKVIVRFTDGTEVTLDPQVVISDGKKDEKLSGNRNANANRR